MEKKSFSSGLLRVKLRDDFILESPIMPASGTFGYGDELVDMIELKYYGAIISKTITLQPRSGNLPERICETSCGMLNSIGLANIGVDRFIQEKEVFYSSFHGKRIVNISGSCEGEYLEVIKRLEKCEWVDGYEINVSCPNVDRGGIAFGTDSHVLRSLIGKIRNNTDRFLMVKLTPNVSDICSIAVAVQEAGADAVSMINTLYGAAIDVERKKPALGRVVGGYSGPGIKPVAIALILKVKPELDIPIVGIGGICNGEDAIEFFMAGASAIQIGTAHFSNPAVAKDIYNYLVNYCAKEGISSIEKIVGVALR
ncbi:MAG TPA: dihydroorotate dehydrogenase [Candidatus Marinimicrobia bacterium]|nr:dihydroorotate dehydrogenase [Candidatus Neomarinimicrobiota bacterium]